MKEYAYKDSGIEWLGEIPEHWGLDRIKGRVVINESTLSSNTEDDLEINYLDISNVNSKGIIEPEKIRNINFSDAPSRARRKVNVFDTVISSVRTNLQAIAYIDFELKNFICSTGFFVCKPKKDSKIHNKYLYYFLLSEHSKNFLTSRSLGVSYPAIDEHKFGKLNIPLAPFPEQKAIADYLDSACQKIDRVIELKEKQIEKIEKFFKNRLSELMTVGIGESVVKKTKYPWIESVNKNWKVKPLKRLLEEKLTYGANESAEEENVDHPRYIRITDFDENGFLRSGTFKTLSPELAKPYLLEEGDVLFARSGATVGKTFIFKNYQGEACFAGYLIRARTKKSKLIPEYLYYFTKSNVYDKWKNLIFTQSTIQNIGADKYQYLPIPIPNTDEQKEIVQQIENLWHLVDNQKGKLLRQIEILKNYRKSLIHECVTGKKRVYDGDIPVEEEVA